VEPRLRISEVDESILYYLIDNDSKLFFGLSRRPCCPARTIFLFFCNWDKDKTRHLPFHFFVYTSILTPQQKQKCHRTTIVQWNIFFCLCIWVWFFDNINFFYKNLPTLCLYSHTGNCFLLFCSLYNQNSYLIWYLIIITIRLQNFKV